MNLSLDAIDSNTYIRRLYDVNWYLFIYLYPLPVYVEIVTNQRSLQKQENQGDKAKLYMCANIIVVFSVQKQIVGVILFVIILMTFVYIWMI